MVAGASATFTPRTGRFCSANRSTTPEPKPITSTNISCGCSITVASSNLFLTAPQSCMRSMDGKVTKSKTVFPWRTQRAELSPPKRATSNPQTIGSFAVKDTSRFIAPRMSSIGMTVSSSADGNSPMTSTLDTVESSPYCSIIFWNNSLSVPSTSRESICSVFQYARLE